MEQSPLPLFLSPVELAELTGMKQKSRQIKVLNDMRIAYRINASGRPVVTRSAVEGRPLSGITSDNTRAWVPSVLNRSK